MTIVTDPRRDGDLVISIHQATVNRDGADLIRAVDWQVELDERWVILGPNGAGKTTLLSLAAARLFPTAGSVSVLGQRLGGVDVGELRTRIGFSSAALQDRIPAHERVRDVVLTAAWSVFGRQREPYEQVDEGRALALLDQFGIARFAERAYGSLSEGERKRAQIARALMTDPELLLLDEPAAGLDLGAREELIDRLGGLAADPNSPAIVLVTHHVEEIPAGFTHAMVLREGSVVGQGLLRATVTSATLSRAFATPLRVRYTDGRFSARAG
jgi:iron complex transport system ATP-binding protein